ncbi:MAG: hypothetical protein IJ529_04975 [Alphaproteobacteria bacterium]|nr:hypothetical protein [Alphaproteobacteria bacterium]
MNTNRITIYVLLFAVVFFSIAASSYLKNSVYRLENELRGIKQNIQTDKESIHVLNAEWSKLNNPARLRNLSANHIKLNPIRGEQIINYSALPLKGESEKTKKLSARQNIAAQAQANRSLKKLANNVR